MSIVKSSIVLAFWTILSRITGFLRDSIMAKYLGSSMLSDVIVAATKIPNSFRRLLGEGAMFAVFIPMFSKLLAENKKVEAKFFASQIFTYLSIFLIILTIICEIFMGEIVGISSFGFKNDPEKFNLTVNLARINFIYLITISLSSLCGGVLNSIGKFAFFAAMPILFNLGLVLVFLFAKDFSKIGYIYSYSCVAIGFLQLFIIILACKYYGFGVHANFSLKSSEFGIFKFLKKMGNGLIASGIYQINILIDSIFASMFASGVSYLYYTDRLSQLPLTLIGGTMSVSLLPVLSKNVKIGDQKKTDEIHNQSILFAFFAITLCLAIIFSTGREMVSFVYERGEFSSQDAETVTKLLKIFSLGFIFTVFSKIYSAFLFANLNTKIPMLIGCFCMVVNLIFNLILYKKHGYFCVAYASTVSAFFSGILTMIYVLKHNFTRFYFDIFYKIVLILFIGFITYLFQKFVLLEFFLLNKSCILSFLAIVLSCVLYICLTLLFKVYKIYNLVSVFSKK